MKKNSFLNGAFIATLGIVLSKILGIIYVIPFYSVVGSQGGALYGYAYSIYTIFLGISQAGIPVAIAKIISEYNTLGYNEIKERTFKLGKKVLTILGIICFLIMFLCAKALANIIIGTITGGNTIDNVTHVIRVISFALLIVPLISIYRGYFEGHKFITPAITSQIIEQIIRVLIIVVGSYLTLNIFHLSLTTTISVAVFAATIGALISYFYLIIKAKKNSSLFEKKDTAIKNINISNKKIIIKIFTYSFPFVMIDIFRSLINSVDVFMLVKVLVNDLSYSITKAEEIMSVISTWGQKINMIVISICSGIIVSLVPNLTSSFVKKDFKAINLKINQAIQWAAYLTIPMTFGISFLAGPIWTVFYGTNTICTSVYKYYIFVSLSNIIFTIGTVSLQLLQEQKKVLIYLIIGLLTNALLNIPLLHLFNYLKLPAYYGSTTATILGYSICGVLSLKYIRKKYSINYKVTFIKLFKIISMSIIMILILLVIRHFFPFKSTNRIINIVYIVIYTLIGSFIYLFISFKSKIFYQIFGTNILPALKNKING